jgi:toxin ParE1/3/4
MARRCSPGCAKEAKRGAGMPSLFLSDFVEDELEAIWDYIAFDNIDAADRFLAAVTVAFRELASRPRLGRLRKFPRLPSEEVRSFRVKGFKNYLIFYRPIPNGIEILHVIHGARNLEQFWQEH